MPDPDLDSRLETVPVSRLKPHPNNYRSHPPDQLTHLVESIREHGVYRNVVAAQEYTLLAGHGVWEAAQLAGLTELPVLIMPFGPFDARALKVLAADNTSIHLSETDDRALSELLREIDANDADGLLGTGFDRSAVAGLIYVTRDATEVPSRNDAAVLAGLVSGADWEPVSTVRSLVIRFRTPDDRTEVANILGMTFFDRQRTFWWPPAKPGEDLPLTTDDEDAAAEVIIAAEDLDDAPASDESAQLVTSEAT